MKFDLGVRRMRGFTLEGVDAWFPECWKGWSSHERVTGNSGKD